MSARAMSKHINKSDIEKYIGHVCEPTDWFEVTQKQVNEFAECTLDRQFIHIDPVAAAATPFGGTIAHGFLTLSMLSYFSCLFYTSDAADEPPCVYSVGLRTI